jgi:protein-disulfide isomerase
VPTTMDEELPDLILPIEQRDHAVGPIGARYSLVEYGDYECPQCAEFYPIAKELVRELGDDLCFVFRNFPLVRSHPHAEAAAEAAEAAGMQGKFWLMHDRLFEHPEALTAEDLRRRAVALPLEMATYERDLASGEAARRVAEDVESGTDAGVGGTPTLFVNGRMHEGTYEFLPLLTALRAARR